MKNIHLIPTDKPSRLFKDDNQVLNLHTHSVLKGIFTNGIGSNQHIYITNSEEIKEGDWFSEKAGRQYPIQWDGKQKLNFHCKKIILTTDQSLDGVQAIDDEFLEWFIDNPTCGEVEVKWIKTPDGIFYHKDNVPYGCYKIIIPKEESNLDKHLASLPEYPGPRRSAFVSKQEILEEAAETNSEKHHYAFGQQSEFYQIGFIEGAKWQQEPEQFFSDDRVKTLEKSIEYLLKRQERMYSEEEVSRIITSCKEYLSFGDEFNEKEWFEQYKKKV